MKKCLLPFAAFIILCSLFVLSSCTKKTHYPHPSPGGVRISSYSVVLDTPVAGIGVGTVIPTSSGLESDNYSFGYDSLNRVSYIIFTSNNPYRYNTNAYFVYSNDSIYKTTYSTMPSVLLETDTFLVNGNGMITTAYTPNVTTLFQYYGKLLTIKTTTNELTGITYTEKYTSLSGNWLENTNSQGPAATQDFAYNLHYSNRPGDYLQIGSFTMYGSNVYQYTNMVNTIAEPAYRVSASYNIDAYSNVLNTTVTSIDLLLGATYKATYSFQYSNY